MFRSSPTRLTVILLAIAVGLAGCGGGGGERVDDPGRPETSAVDPMPAGPPLYELDPSFPPELPNSWVMGVPSSGARRFHATISGFCRDHVRFPRNRWRMLRQR